MQQPTFFNIDHLRPVYKPAIFILITLYLVSCFSPLRLEFDSVRYFAIKDCLQMGCPPDSAAAKDFLPYGYPVLLAALSAIGLLNSFSIAFINGIYLLFGLMLARKLFSNINALFFYTILLLNWAILKLFAYPLSEMQYLFFSAASLSCFYQYSKTKNGWQLLLSFLFAVLAVFTRTIGVSLVLALLIALIWEHRKLLRQKIYLLSGLTVAAILILFIALSLKKFSGITHYIDAILNQPGKAILNHFEEWGQLFINMPIGKLKSYMPEGIIDGIFLLAGLVLLVWFIYALIKSRKTTPAVITIYLVIYSLVIFNWSHFDPRFWVPVLPFIAGIILQAPLPKWRRIALPVVFIVYSLMGIAAFGYSFYTQFNKKAFARTQANGIFRNEYEIHFFGKTLADTTAPLKPNVLRLLEKYDD